MGTGFKDSKILVVGGAGFVGSNLCHRLLEDAPRKLVIVDNLLSADMANVPQDERVEFHPKSIADDRLLRTLEKDFDYVFHLATYHGNQSSMHDPLADHDNNTYTTLQLCEWLKDAPNLKKLVYSSAGCTVAKKTFDETEATSEEAPVSLYLDSPYQISKIIGEFYGNYYLMRYKLPFVKARFQNVYGPREILGAGDWRGTDATIWRNVTPSFVWKSLHGETLPVEKGGVATRDFIFVDDIVEGLMACALRGQDGGVYNLASGVETSILELAETINSLTGNGTQLEMSAAREWDRSGRRFGEVSKAKTEIGFEAKIGLKEGLTRTIEWTQKNQDMITNCIMKHSFFVPSVKKYAQASLSKKAA
jgi:UDP-glucose 4-epimerase